MARLVRHDSTTPFKIDPKTLPPDKLISICACGLSQKLPFCDGSHKSCLSEMPGTLYVYGPDRRSLSATLPDDGAETSTHASPP